MVAAGVAALLGPGGCGPTSTSPAERAAERSFVATLHSDDPTVNEVRSDTQLLRMGAAACSGFAAGVSFYSLADNMAVHDGNLPIAVLGDVITAAAEDLCPRYRSRVS